MSDGLTDARRMEEAAESREEREKALPNFIDGFRYLANDVKELFFDYWRYREEYLGIDDFEEKRYPGSRQRVMTKLEELKPRVITEFRKFSDRLEKEF